MVSKLRKRVAKEQKGFTLVELLVVVIILGILTAIAVPSYLSFTSRANNNAAKANVRAIIPTIESYFADNDTYTGMTLDALKSTYDQALDTNKYTLTGVTGSTYCVTSSSGGSAWMKDGPSAAIEAGDCS